MTDTQLLREMNDKLDELLIWKATLDERCKAHRERTEEVRQIIFENPGLKVKVERLWNCKGVISERRAFFMWILKALIVSGIIALIGWFLILYKGH